MMPEPVVSVVTPGMLPVLVTLVIIEVARVGLLRSAAAEGVIEKMPLDVSVAFWSDTEAEVERVELASSAVETEDTSPELWTEVLAGEKDLAREEDLAGTMAAADEDCCTGTIAEELWATGIDVVG